MVDVNNMVTIGMGEMMLFGTLSLIAGVVLGFMVGVSDDD